MNETTFENAKVGDRVWSLPHGWGTVIRIEVKMLQVEFSHLTWWYYLSGACLENHPQTLFWDEVKFEAPPRPKRKVKKVVEGWVNLEPCITESPCREPLYINAVYRSLPDASFNRLPDCVYLGEPLFIRHEYEVEE